MSMFRVNDNPIQPQSNAHFGNACRLQRNPQPKNGLTRGQFVAQYTYRSTLHQRSLLFVFSLLEFGAAKNNSPRTFCILSFQHRANGSRSVPTTVPSSPTKWRVAQQ
jgi:hypothetical protein